MTLEALRRWCALSVLAFAACHPQRGLRKESAVLDQQSQKETKYSIIYVIDGDGSYVYHDGEGALHRADHEALRQAKTVAQNCWQAEVFIFHQQPEQRLLFLLPQKESEFYYYKNGNLLVQQSYFKNHSASSLENAAQFYERYTLRKSYFPASWIKTFFIYFGHQIPELVGPVETALTQNTLTLDRLAGGLKKFQDCAGTNEKFELMILSTCYSGTPGVLSAILPFAKYVVASPENLHLSYLDTGLLAELNMWEEIAGFDAGEIAHELARRSFERLKENAQTTITVAVYETEKIAAFLHGVQSPYLAARALVEQAEDGKSWECYDCIQNPAFNQENAAHGVEVFYRAPRFGRQKGQERHSGWSCWQIKSEKAGHFSAQSHSSH